MKEKIIPRTTVGDYYPNYRELGTHSKLVEINREALDDDLSQISNLIVPGRNVVRFWKDFPVNTIPEEYNNSEVTSLTVLYSEITSPEMDKLISHFPNLTNISLQNCDGIDTLDVPHIKYVSIDYCDNLKSISSLKSATHVEIVGSSFGSLEELPTMPSVQILRLNIHRSNVSNLSIPNDFNLDSLVSFSAEALSGKGESFIEKIIPYLENSQVLLSTDKYPGLYSQKVSELVHYNNNLLFKVAEILASDSPDSLPIDLVAHKVFIHNLRPILKDIMINSYGIDSELADNLITGGTNYFDDTGDIISPVYYLSDLFSDFVPEAHYLTDEISAEALSYLGANNILPDDIL